MLSKGSSDRFGPLALDPATQGELGARGVDHSNGALICYGNKVTFPLPWQCAVFDLRRTKTN